MNREEFMRRLEQALRGMPEEERRNAMQYYADYFDEAGEENEEEVTRTLGAPEKVAADILREFRDVSIPQQEKQQTSGFSRTTDDMASKFRTMDSGQKLLFLILACIALVAVVPACVGVVGGLGGILIGLICAVFVIFLIVPILAAAAWICAFALVVAAVWNAAEVSIFILLIGLALIAAACGILLWRLTLVLFRAVFPNLLRGIVSMLRTLVDALRRPGK